MSRLSNDFLFAEPAMLDLPDSNSGSEKEALL